MSLEKSVYNKQVAKLSSYRKCSYTSQSHHIKSTKSPLSPLGPTCMCHQAHLQRVGVLFKREIYEANIHIPHYTHQYTHIWYIWWYNITDYLIDSFLSTC